jgi:Type II CAAX prenyl endopeptidase Rce1-like
MPASAYYHDSRSPRYAILFAVPLFLAYEVLAFALSRPGVAEIRNGADVILQSLFYWLGGAAGIYVFEALLVGAGLWLVVRDLRRHPGRLRVAVFGGMTLEAVVLALAVGIVVRGVTGVVLHYVPLSLPGGLGVSTQLMVSLGAGIYEELLFRVIVVGGLAALGTRVLRWSRGASWTMAVVIGALLFSAFHYIGPYADTLRWSSFLFRFFAGGVFSVLYLLRGFGITAWTHALYDVFVTLGQAL